MHFEQLHQLITVFLSTTLILEFTIPRVGSNTHKTFFFKTNSYCNNTHQISETLLPSKYKNSAPLRVISLRAAKRCSLYSFHITLYRAYSSQCVNGFIIKTEIDKHMCSHLFYPNLGQYAADLIKGYLSCRSVKRQLPHCLCTQRRQDSRHYSNTIFIFMAINSLEPNEVNFICFDVHICRDDVFRFEAWNILTF